MGGRPSRQYVGGEPPTECKQYIDLIMNIFFGRYGWKGSRTGVNNINSSARLTELAFANIASDSDNTIASCRSALDRALNGKIPNDHQTIAMGLADKWDTALASAQDLRTRLKSATEAAQAANPTIKGAFNVQFVGQKFIGQKHAWDELVAVIYVDGMCVVAPLYSFTNREGIKGFAWTQYPDIGVTYKSAAELLQNAPKHRSGRALIDLIELSD